MTKREYLTKLKNKADKVTESQTPHGQKRRRLMALILGIGTALSIFAGSVFTDVERESKYSAFIENETVAKYDSLSYKDSFELWVKSELGNNPNSLLTGGRLFKSEDLTIFPDTAGKGYVFITPDKEMQIESRISYLNIKDNVVYYRDDNTRNIMSLDLSSSTPKLLKKTNCGELFLSNDKLYYTDFSASNFIRAIDLETGDTIEILDESAQSFVVIGDDLVYHNISNDLCIYNLQTGNSVTVVKNIERYFLQKGLIVAESGNTVFSFELNGSHAVELYTSSNEYFSLVGITSSGIFICEDGKLFCFDVESSTPIEVSSTSYLKYDSLIEYEDSFYVIAYSDEIGKTVTDTLVSISRE